MTSKTFGKILIAMAMVGTVDCASTANRRPADIGGGMEVIHGAYDCKTNDGMVSFHFEAGASSAQVTSSNTPMQCSSYPRGDQQTELAFRGTTGPFQDLCTGHNQEGKMILAATQMTQGYVQVTMVRVSGRTLESSDRVETTIRLNCDQVRGNPGSGF
jgi:hypothetical protein